MQTDDAPAPGPAHDPDTLAFYEREAASYARWLGGTARGAEARLDRFVKLLTPGGRVLELGCGSGRDAEALSGRGFEVTATDGSAAMAEQAARRLGRPVKVMRFDELDETEAYDGVWANAALLHVPAAALPAVLIRVKQALKPGAPFYASYKKGGAKGEGRDDMGRLYNYPTPDGLRAAYAAAGPWASFALDEATGLSYDGAIAATLHVIAVKP